MCFVLFLFGHMERHMESYFLNYWSHPHPLHCKQGLLTNGSPGNSPKYMFLFSCCCSWVTKSCLTLCDPMDYSPPGSSVHGIILEWVAISYSRGSYPPRDQTHISCIARRILYHWAIEEAPDYSNHEQGWNIWNSRKWYCWISVRNMH